MDDNIQKTSDLLHGLIECSSSEELKALAEWTNTHEASCPMQYTGAIGGKYTYSFTPTSLGTVHKVACACGASHDATRYDWW